MGLRFRKSFKIAPGVKLNLNKNSTSITFGKRGAHYTVNSKGKKTASVGIPGTGISYTMSTGSRTSSKKTTNQGGPNMFQNNFPDYNGNNKKWYQKTGWIIALIILFFPVGLFLMWKYTDWKKPVKFAVTAFILFFAIVGLFSPDNLEEISLSANTTSAYDINQEVTITVSTTPNDYKLSDSDFKCTGGKLNIENGTITFLSSSSGSYEIWAEHDEIKSNELVIKVEDKKAIAAAKAQKEAEEKAAKEAEEEAERKKAEEEAKAQAAAQAEAEAEAQRQAQAEAEAQQQAQAEAQQQTQTTTSETVYWTPNGELYHSTPDCPSLGRSKTIYNGTIAESGKSRPCKNCY